MILLSNCYKTILTRSLQNDKILNYYFKYKNVTQFIATKRLMNRGGAELQLANLRLMFRFGGQKSRFSM